MSSIEENRAFDTKVTNLIAATIHLDIPQILLLRRITLADPESRRWASERQLRVVFSVIVAKAVERIGLERLREARTANFLPLLPPGLPAEREEDLQVLTEVATQMLGNPQAPLSEHEEALEKLLAMAPAQSQGRTLRASTPIKEPPPLFAAQLGPDYQRVVIPGGLGGGDDRPFVDFPTLFDDTICAFSRKLLTLFQVHGSERKERMPFLLAPSFAACYEDVLRRYVLPPMRRTRHIQQLSQSYNWPEVGGAKLIDIIQSGEHNNPILHHWDARWSSFRLSKGKKPLPDDNPWTLLREDATRANYTPPDEEDLPLLQDMVRFELEALTRAWREIGQLYQQEFAPGARQEQARDGAFRDGLLKWSTKLPDHVGEIFAIKAYFLFPRVDGAFLRRLITNYGRSDNERRRVAPYLLAFLQNVTT